MDSNSFEFPPTAKPSLASGDAATSRKPRGSAGWAWLVIIAAIGAMMFPHFLNLKEEVSDPSIIMFEIQARYLVGVASVSVQGEQMVQEQIEVIFNKGSLRQRMIGAILLGELVSPEKAEKSLGELESMLQSGTLKASDVDQNILSLLQRVQSALIAKVPLTDLLNEEESKDTRTMLSQKLGWVGRLALLPPGSPDREGRTRLVDHARRTFFVMLGVFGIGVLAAICGTVLQIVWWIFAATGELNCGTQKLRGDGAIYAETFAVWMALFVVLNIAIMSLPLPKWGLIWVLIPQIGSMGALAWPVFRGLSWLDVRRDLGLSFGPQPWSVPCVGVGAYLSALPVVAVAMIVTLLMMAVASQFAVEGDSTGVPIHPIVEPILRGSWTVRLQLLLVAVFAAVPEEIFFRGALYRHLREVGTKFGYVIGVAFAALFSSFVFAVIHPQGLFGIPILMGLAMVFAFVREWRGSIVPSMIAHALVNAGTSTILFLIAD